MPSWFAIRQGSRRTSAKQYAKKERRHGLVGLVNRADKFDETRVDVGITKTLKTLKP